MYLTRGVKRAHNTLLIQDGRLTSVFIESLSVTLELRVNEMLTVESKK